LGISLNQVRITGAADERGDQDVTFWRSVGKERRREYHPKYALALDLRSEKPESVEWVGHLVATEAKRHYRYRRMKDAGQGSQPFCSS
jgi:hypothetical protein